MSNNRYESYTKFPAGGAASEGGAHTGGHSDATCGRFRSPAILMSLQVTFGLLIRRITVFYLLLNGFVYVGGIANFVGRASTHWA